MKIVEKGVCAAKGFEAAGVCGGIKHSRKDMALVYSVVPAVAAGVFTTNQVKAWCVRRNQDIIASGNPVQAIIANSGCANACTGEEGKENNIRIAKQLGEVLGIDAGSVVTGATGVIGAQLPMDKLENGIGLLANSKGADGEHALSAATAILTTDTRPKSIAVSANIHGREVHIGGMVKGSGMIHPNMATMLCYLTTDCAITKPLLQKALREAVVESFNMISVDGDTSTNDMAILLANGMAENPTVDMEDEGYREFFEALRHVCLYLAKEMVKDGEGATKFIEVQIHGADTKEHAARMAKSVITSSLVKTAFFGEDANWGRILCAMGYSGAPFNPDTVTIRFQSGAGDILLMDHGTPIVFSEETAAAILREKEITVLVDLEQGEAQATAWGSDLSYEYVKINGDYRS